MMRLLRLFPLLFLVTFSASESTIASIGGVYRGTLRNMLFSLGHSPSCCEGCTCELPPELPTNEPTTNSSNTSNSSRRLLAIDRRDEISTVCVANEVKVDIELFIDSAAGVIYYWSAELEVMISGRVMHIEEVQTSGRMVSLENNGLALQAFAKPEATSCTRLSQLVSATGEAVLSYGLTTGIEARYGTCDAAAATGGVSCTVDEPSEITVRATLSRLDDDEAAGVKSKHGWVDGAREPVFCSINKSPFLFFGPVDCHFVEEEEGIPVWMFMAAALLAVLLCSGLCFTGWRWSIQKFGKSRSFWCIICICSYQMCYMEERAKRANNEEAELEELTDEKQVKPNLYKPGWAQKYGDQDKSSWSKFSA